MSTLGLAFGDKEVLLFHHPDDFDNHLFIGKDLFQLFMSEQGRYSRLWQNLPLDHHMPLYFLFLNIFGAGFYTHFTILPAIIVNVLTLLGLLCGFYLVTLQLFQKQNIACIGLLFFAFMERDAGAFFGNICSNVFALDYFGTLGNIIFY